MSKSLLKLTCCAWVFWAPLAWGITLDATSSGESATSPLTFAHTVTASGGNRSLVVVCGFRERVVTLSATYGGVSMTEVRRDQHPTSTNISSWIFRLTNPPTGANNVVVTQSSGNTALTCGAISHTDVNQTTPVGDHDGQSSSTATCSPTHTLTLTVASTDVLVDVYARSSGTAVLTEGADQTEFMDLVSGATVTTAASYQLGSVDGVMSYSTDTGGSCGHSAVSLQHDAFVVPSAGGSPIWFQ